MMKLVKGVLTLIVLAFAGLMATDDTPASIPSSTPTGHEVESTFANSYNAEDNWLIYWYVCGADLETKYGAATADINEMLASKIPANVRVLLQAGGANEWKNAVIKSGKTNRFLYDSEGLHELEITADANMGDPATVADFLRYGESKFNADHKVFIFWDHGGGSAFGVCHDERAEKFLSLNDIRSAFESVFTPSETQPPFELIGFDACLMATFDTANTLHGFTKYMVASEELEPGNGWEYVGFLNALGKNPAMGGDALGQVICDSYYAGCKAGWTDDEATLSVINVTKMPQLRAAYDAFNVEAIKASAQNPKRFFSSLGRSAKRSENYGSNTRDTYYFDMVDIADFADKSRQLMPQTAQQLINAVDDAVVYRVNGEYRSKGAGISGFYPYDGENEIYDLYAQQDAATLPQKCLYYHQIYGVLPPEADDILNGNYRIELPPPTQMQQLFTLDSLEDIKLSIDNQNNASVTLTQAQLENISHVYCNLAYVDTKADAILYVGSDRNVRVDWESGKITDNFDATWPMLDGHAVYVEMLEANDDYNLYAIPIKLNGERVNLHVAYNYKEGKYKILGAKRLVKRGVPDKNLIKLAKGDRITTLHYGLSISGDDADFTEVEVETFTVGDNPKFQDENLVDGEYLYCFEFVTPSNESVSSDYVNFTVKGGKIFVETL